MQRLNSFPPVADRNTRILILGSMPGQRSLDAQQYYAHPHNAFWKIMGELVGAQPQLPYDQRLEKLKQAGIALWDVLHSCTREGSLDSDIQHEQANDFGAFFADHPLITHVYFNGGKAEQSFRKFVLKQQALPELALHRLPSTSPAYAGMRYEEKLEEWRNIMSQLPPLIRIVRLKLTRKENTDIYQSVPHNYRDACYQLHFSWHADRIYHLADIVLHKPSRISRPSGSFAK
jgi:hypoxanthine-DNA glycosylase